MLNWLFGIIFKKKLDEIEKIRKAHNDSICEAIEAKNFALRNNIISVPVMDFKSPQFRSEIASIWKNESFQFLLYQTRNEFIAGIIRGDEAAARNVSGMLKGIEAICLKMQELTLQTGRTENNEEIQS